MDISQTTFRDRVEAGAFLAARLAAYKDSNPVAVGLPRGGVVIAAEIARAIKCDMDVLIAGKLRAPFNPELAIGAITESGLVFLNDRVMGSIRVDDKYLEEEKRSRLKIIKQRLEAYRRVKAKEPLAGRCVIIADDGIATGSTMISAILAAKAEGADRIIVAVPGGPQDTTKRLCAATPDVEVVCPVMPALFYAVGQLYTDFSQVEDDEVIEILKEFSGNG
ncbi:MAG: phosphoribosyltransferase [Deltaproteobacteria bacterium]|nr:phosphoribosyltransferase [Deltaproteobacteria bacterium]